MSQTKPTVAIAGAGNVGRAVGRALAEAGYPIAAVMCRTRGSAEAAARFIGAGRAVENPAEAGAADLVLIGAPDRAIAEVCERIAREGGFRPRAVVMHFSGALSSKALCSAAKRGARVASLHPLQSFPSPEQGVERLPGTVFTFEGDEEAEETARMVVADLGGETIRVKAEAKPLYHAACCVISNYAAAVADLGFDLMARAGIAREHAQRAAMPLLKGTVANIERIGLPAALTGPIDRGDAATVEAHLEAMEGLPEDARELYRALGRRALMMAQEKRAMDPDAAAALARLLGEQ